jgi:hypothetical protein
LEGGAVSGVGLTEIAIVVLWAAVIGGVVIMPWWLLRQVGRNRSEIKRLERRLDEVERRSPREP